MSRYSQFIALSALVFLAVAALPRLYAPERVIVPPPSRVALLDRTLLPMDAPQSLDLPVLQSADGTSFAPERFRGRWTILYFGYTSCPDVCPRTLGVLSRVARDSTSGVPAGTTQLVFVSIEPTGDTPARMRAYLSAFDSRLSGLTGSPAEVTRFSDAVGAAASASSTGIDHSTSLFVLNPDGELAGVMLRPDDAVRIVADFVALQQRFGAPRRVASVR